MRQALHIFKKDVRHLCFEIAIVLFAVTAFAFIEARHALQLADPTYRRSAASTLAMFLLPLAWWTLIGRAIHDEALPGDRQFWITRPYSWGGLLGAKILLVLAFINLPMLIADSVILRAYGLPLGPALPGLLWSQVLLSVVFLLPIFALSALTTGFVQLIVAVLAPSVILLMFAIPRPGIVLGGFPIGLGAFRLDFMLGAFAGGYDWVQSYILYLLIAFAGWAILLWQYRRRGTTVARGFACAVAVLVVLRITSTPWSTAFKIQSWLSKGRVDLSAVHADYDPNDKSPTRVGHIDEQMRVELPIQITGLPPDASLEVEGFTAEFDAPDGSVRKIDQRPRQSYLEMGQHFSLRPSLDTEFYRQVKDEPLAVRGELYLTVYGNRQSTRVPFGDGSFVVPRVGVCAVHPSINRRAYFLICSSAFRYPATLVSYRFFQSTTDTNRSESPLGQRRTISYSPFPAEVGISPINQEFVQVTASVPWKEVVVSTTDSLDHIRIKFEINGLRLADYEMHPSQPLY